MNLDGLYLADERGYQFGMYDRVEHVYKCWEKIRVLYKPRALERRENPPLVSFYNNWNVSGSTFTDSHLKTSANDRSIVAQYPE